MAFYIIIIVAMALELLGLEGEKKERWHKTDTRR